MRGGGGQSGPSDLRGGVWGPPLLLYLVLSKLGRRLELLLVILSRVVWKPTPFSFHLEM